MYSPLPTNGDCLSPSRPPSMDADSVSLHSVYYNNGSASPRIRQHPITKKPSVKQRSRDVERGPPAQGRPAGDKVQWSWLPSAAGAPPPASLSDSRPSAEPETVAASRSNRPSLPPTDRRKLSDSESEVMDTLTDLARVTSATSARGATTPRDIIADPFSAMRKRSASSEGDRFYRENGLMPGKLYR